MSTHTSVLEEVERAAVFAWVDREQTATWRATARTEQLPPSGWKRIWYIRGGRGSGKTWAGGNNFADMILESPPGEWGVVAPTYADARDTCMESDESGLIKALGGKCGENGVLLERGPHILTWNRSMGQLRLRNGSRIFATGADEGAPRIQGKNLRGCWCDEIGLWKNWKTAWDESIKYAVRKSPARIIVTGTPKRRQSAIVLVKRLLKDPKVAKSLMHTQDNAANLDPDTLAEYMESKGTPLGLQELGGEVLDEVEGALWTHDEDKAKKLGLGLIVRGPLPSDGLGRRVLAVDPSDAEEDSDEYALAVVTIGIDRRLYVLMSDGVRLGPGGSVDHTKRVYDQWECDAVIVEKNHGGQYLPTMLRELGLPVQTVSASVGKRTRAEPVAALYAPGRPGVVHVGDAFEELEAQMTAYTGAPGEDSPDRLDALVWGCTALAGGIHGGRKMKVHVKTKVAA